MYMAAPGVTLESSKLSICISFEPFWACEALGNMLTSIVSNSLFGKRSVARDMTIFVCRFPPMLPNMYFLIHEIFRNRPQSEFWS